MHPITVIETIIAVGFVLILFVIALIFTKKIRKLGFMIASFITIMIILFFIVRPFWIDYQVSEKMEQLNQYLQEKYPNERWEITRKIGRQYNPYHLNVEFENEKGWIYTYSVVRESHICQRSWVPPEGKFPNEGQHFERHCKSHH